MGIREQGGVGQEQAQVQIDHVCLTAEEQTVDVHHHHAGQIIQVKSKGAPDVFHGSSQGVVAEQGDGGQQQIARAVGQGIGDKPPDLTL